MRSVFCLIVLWCTFGTVVWAWQTPPGNSTDTLLATLKTRNSTGAKISYLLAVAEKEQYNHPDTSYRAANEALVLATVANDNLLLARSCFWRSWIYFQNKPKPYDLALADVIKSLGFAQKANSPYDLAFAYGLKAGLEFSINKSNTDTIRADLGRGFEQIQKITDRSRDSLWLTAYLTSILANVENNNTALRSICRRKR